MRRLARTIAGLTAIPLVLAGLLAVAATPVAAQVPPLVDDCVGVDHPPFDRAYPPGGLSYILVGTAADGPTELIVIVQQIGQPAVERRQAWTDAPGTMLEAFPIRSFGTYRWWILGPGRTELAFGALVVTAAEVPCNLAALATAAPPPATATLAPSAAPSPAPSPSAAPTASAAPAPTPAGEVTGGLFRDPIWLILIVIGLLLAMAGGLILLFGIDFAGTQSCPDECPTLGAKRNCSLSAFGISSQGRTPDNDAGINLALTMMDYAPLPGTTTGLLGAGGKILVTGTPSPLPLPATPSGAAKGPTIDMTRELMGFLNTRFPQIWIKLDYDECTTARCFPQLWRTYRAWRRRTSPWIQVREGTATIADPMGVFPAVSEWSKPDILRAINQAIVDTVNTQGCQ